MYGMPQRWIARMGSGRRAGIPGWALAYAVSCAGLLAFVYLSIWAFNGFDGLGLDRHGAIALTIGTLLTAALGITLMGLAFYSDRVVQGVHRSTGNGRGESIGE